MVLSVSPNEDDHVALQTIFNHASWKSYTECSWTLCRSATLASALATLRRNLTPIIVCERDLPSATWKDLLASIEPLDHPPFLIVTSRHADEYLWAEALNLGAFDVLAKPFETREVVRIISLAWLHWSDQNESCASLPGGKALSELTVAGQMSAHGS
jgi:DNA-binding response OmpR family regulator